MKRLWFAGVFLLLALALCIDEQIFIHRFYSDMTTAIHTAQTHALEEKQSELEKDIITIHRLWLKHNERLLTVTNHATLNEMGVKIRALYATDKNIEEELSEIQALTRINFENQRITLANIL